MASDTITRQCDCGAANDIISNLPRNMIELILKRLPVHDAARTSILSRTWRNIWGMHPHLLFDEVFFSQIRKKYKDTQLQLSKISRTIGDILLVHSGPILKFHLSIPKDLPYPQSLCMDLWIKNISNNGVRIFELFNNPPIAYKMPSYLFSCLELTHLSLTNCVLNPPHRFEGFCNLISVKLVDVIITAYMSFGTQLKEIDLERCTGIEHLACQFKYNNSLTMLIIIESGEIDCGWFECTQNVQRLCLLLKGAANSTAKVINLDKLVGKMPRMFSLELDGFFLKCLEADADILKRLITTMENMKALYLDCVGLYDLVQIKYILCLIRSSPKLRDLDIALEPSAKSSNGMDVAASMDLKGSSVEQYFQLPNSIDMIVDQLENVEIRGMVGSRVELRFIKLLLANSPSLRWMKLKYYSIIGDPKEKLRISQELLKFPRASTAAQIIWT